LTLSVAVFAVSEIFSNCPLRSMSDMKTPSSSRQALCPIVHRL
jgi:hypothetical protein